MDREGPADPDASVDLDDPDDLDDADGTEDHVGRQRRDDGAVSVPVGQGTAQLVPDPDRPGSVTVLVEGTPQSHVDLADPTHLAFEYVRRLGHVVDALAPAGEPVDALHLGGGALTLARYVAATRPGSRQRAFELDAALVELVRRELPLERTARVRVGIVDARAGLASVAPASADLVVLDVFAGARTPGHLTTVEVVELGARALRPGGVWAANVGDGPPLAFARSYAATVRAVLPQVAVLAEPAVLRGRRFGNLVVVGSAAPLPLPALTRACAGDPVPGRVVDGAELDRFTAGAPVLRDAAPQDSPPPPEGLFSRGRGR
jgi:hypothetical protein